MEAKKDLALSVLLRASQTGDKAAYAQFLKEITPILRSYLHRRMERKDMLEDILQDTLLAVHRSRHSFIEGRLLGPWLYTICQHRMLDMLRRHRRVEKMEWQVPEDLERLTDGIAAEEPSHDELSPQLQKILARLPDKQRQVLELMKEQDLSVKEVAERTGLSVSNVKVTAFRAYETIRRLWKREENQ